MAPLVWVRFSQMDLAAEIFLVVLEVFWVHWGLLQGISGGAHVLEAAA